MLSFLDESMAPGFGHGSMVLPGAQILFKANMSWRAGDALPPSGQGSELRLKVRDTQSWLEAMTPALPAGMSSRRC